VGTLAAASAGCFALFPLDGYGPAEAAVDATPGADSTADGAPLPDAARDASPPSRLIFVTSTEFVPAGAGWAGPSGADQLCIAAAVDAKLPNAGAFRAWVADVEPDGSVGERIPSQLAALPDDRVLVDTTGEVVAGSVAELVDSGPRISIHATEDAAVVADTPEAGKASTCPTAIVWTGLSATGQTAPGTCKLWTTNAPAVNGGAGRIGKSPTEWTEACNANCARSGRLYCVQQ
jgi:hypothetical protein